MFEKVYISPVNLARHQDGPFASRGDLNTICAWLGHVSLNTTNIYAEIDLKMKAKALAHCEIPGSAQEDKHWRKTPGVIEFLRVL